MVYRCEHANKYKSPIQKQTHYQNTFYSFPASYYAEEVGSLTRLPSWSSGDQLDPEPTLNYCPEIFAREFLLFQRVLPHQRYTNELKRFLLFVIKKTK